MTVQVHYSGHFSFRAMTDRTSPLFRTLFLLCDDCASPSFRTLFFRAMTAQVHCSRPPPHKSSIPEIPPRRFQNLRWLCKSIIQEDPHRKSPVFTLLEIRPWRFQNLRLSCKSIIQDPHRTSPVFLKSLRGVSKICDYRASPLFKTPPHKSSVPEIPPRRFQNLR
jgi:hypothetical protein